MSGLHHDFLERQARQASGKAPKAPDPESDVNWVISEHVLPLRARLARQRRLMCFMIGLSWTAGLGMGWWIWRL